MLEFKLGDYVEVGIGESPYDEDGFSYYFQMDREGYYDFEIIQLFANKGHVLYVNQVNDEDAIHFAGNKKFSDFLEEASKSEYFKIELKVKLLKYYHEMTITMDIAKAIFSLDGKLIGSITYEKYEDYTKMEIEAKLPENYNEAKLDEEISHVISSMNGQVLESKKYKKNAPTNI